MDAVVLLGAPGSGKGTQTGKLCDDFGYHRVSTGDIIRSEIRDGTLLGKSVAQYQATGMLVPDDTVCEMVFSNLSRIDGRGLVFDGFPRTLLQAQRLERFFVERDLRGFIFLFDVTFENIENRIVNRVSCPGCNAVFNSQVDGVSTGAPCPRCGTRIGVRQDDTIEVLRHRYDIFRREVDPILEFYGDKVHVIAGNRPADDVYLDITEQMNLSALDSRNS